LKLIARSPEWQLQWVASKNGNNAIFNRDLSDWSPSQALLCHYSRYYDNIMEFPDHPGEEQMKDDEFVKLWVEAKNREQKDGRGSSSASGNTKVTRAMFS
jgi:hypothetical protein